MSYDYLIVGAGSAGCVLAHRLSEDPGTSVVLLEAGGPDTQREIHIPAGFPKLFKTEVDWAYETEPQQQLGDRRLYWPRGKVLGGSSSINAMIYIRGHRATYDEWAGLGNPGWSYGEVLPYFKRSENYEQGASEHHGTGGLLNVALPRAPNPLSLAFIEAAAEVGLERNDDFNGERQEGAGLYHLTQKKGQRHSTAAGFLKPAMRRPNLRVVTGALATRLLLDGTRVTGAEYLKDGALETAAAGETVLCGGTVNSPQLLMLSGIGPAAGLEDHDIAVAVDLPGVGDNLLDHLFLTLNYECRKPITLAAAESLGNVARYLLFKKGLLTSNVGEAGGFVRLRPDAAAPELQFHFAPSYYVNHGFDNPEGHGFGIGATMVQPRSKGRLTLRSADPQQPPAIAPDYLTDRADLEVLIEGARLGRRIAQASPFDAYRGREVVPGAEAGDSDGLEAAVRRGVETLYHPVGTCKMGSDPQAVVDAELKVHGVDALRVADASIMPTIMNGNTNAPTIMIAEKAADLIRG